MLKTQAKTLRTFSHTLKRSLHSRLGAGVALFCVIVIVFLGLVGGYFWWQKWSSNLSRFTHLLPESSVVFSFDVRAVGVHPVQGLVSLDLDTQLLGQLTRRVDDVYRTYSEVLETAEEEEDNLDGEAEEEGEVEADSEYDVSPALPQASPSVPSQPEGSEPDAALVLGGSPFDEPARSFINELWNGSSFTLGSVVALDLSAREQVALAAHQLANRQPDAFLRALFGMSSFAFVDSNPQTGVHHGLVQVHIIDLENFVDAVCLNENSTFNVCDRFGMSAEDFHLEAQSWLGVLGDSFNFQLHFYWIQKGTALVWSNRESWVEKVADTSASFFKPAPVADSNSKLNLISGADGATQLHVPFFAKPLQDPQMSGVSSESLVPTVFRVGLSFHLRRVRMHFLQLLSAFSEPSSADGLLVSDLLQSPEGQELVMQVEDKMISMTRTAELLAFNAVLRGSTLHTQLWEYKPDVPPSEPDFTRIGLSVVNSALSALLPYEAAGMRNEQTQLFAPAREPVVLEHQGWSVLDVNYLLSELKPLLLNSELLSKRQTLREF